MPARKPAYKAALATALPGPPRARPHHHGKRRAHHAPTPRTAAHLSHLNPDWHGGGLGKTLALPVPPARPEHHAAPVPPANNPGPVRWDVSAGPVAAMTPKFGNNSASTLAGGEAQIGASTATAYGRIGVFSSFTSLNSASAITTKSTVAVPAADLQQTVTYAFPADAVKAAPSLSYVASGLDKLGTIPGGAAAFQQGLNVLTNPADVAKINNGLSQVGTVAASNKYTAPYGTVAQSYATQTATVLNNPQVQTVLQNLKGQDPATAAATVRNLQTVLEKGSMQLDVKTNLPSTLPVVTSTSFSNFDKAQIGGTFSPDAAPWLTLKAGGGIASTDMTTSIQQVSVADVTAVARPTTASTRAALKTLTGADSITTHLGTQTAVQGLRARQHMVGPVGTVGAQVDLSKLAGLGKDSKWSVTLGVTGSGGVLHRVGGVKTQARGPVSAQEMSAIPKTTPIADFAAMFRVTYHF